LRSRSRWKTIDRALEAGQAFRSVVRRYDGANRKTLTRPGYERLAGTDVAKAGNASGRSTRWAG
jgi:hypothetical protein